MTHKIDATGKILGRVATEAAMALMGKNAPNYERHKVTGDEVEIVNASKIKASSKKLLETKHEQYTGYPGGFKYVTAAELAEKKGYAELFRLAVYGMLPPNKLRPLLMKKLTVTE